MLPRRILESRRGKNRCRPTVMASRPKVTGVSDPYLSRS
jgi:hypothetical protein